MKILAVQGSPHAMSGNTGKLLEPLIRSAEKAGALVTCLCLADYRIEPCLACDACHKTGRCSVADDFQDLKLTMQSADGLVLASPNYMWSVTAQMKALMDRCCGPMHCQVMDGKHAAAVVASGGPGSQEVQDYLLRFLRAMGFWTVGGVGASAGEISDPSASARCLQAAADLGSRLAEAVRLNKTFPDQQADRAAFVQRMKQLVAARQADWPYEYEYWQSHARL